MLILQSCNFAILQDETPLKSGKGFKKGESTYWYCF